MRAHFDSIVKYHIGWLIFEDNIFEDFVDKYVATKSRS